MKQEHRSFPDNWSNMTDKQVAENIKYLNDNISEYKINAINTKQITIDDNIVITRNLETKYLKSGLSYLVSSYTINGKKYYYDGKMWNTLYGLWSACKTILENPKESPSTWWKNNKSMVKSAVYLSMIAAWAGVLGYSWAHYGIRPKKEKSEQVKKSIDNAKQARMIQYNDSIKSNIR